MVLSDGSLLALQTRFAFYGGHADIEMIKKNCQMTCKPGSVTTAAAFADGYSSRMAVASHLKQPTRTSVQDRTCCIRQRVSLHGLAPDGVYHARSVTSSAVRSYRTFSPLPANPFPVSGGLFSVALSLWLPPPGVTRHPDPVEPGLSSPTEFFCW